MAAARAVVDAAGPLAETTPPRRTGSIQADVRPAIEEIRATRAPRALLAGVGRARARSRAWR